MARDLIEEIRHVQPEGPYSLGGGCEAALVAFEMAIQLQGEGQEIDQLILWITPAPGHPSMSPFGRSVWYRMVVQAQSLIRRGIFRGVKLRTMVNILRHERLEFGIFRAMDKYIPSKKFNGRLTIIRMVDPDVPDPDDDFSLGWKALATEGVVIHTVPGNHDTWLEKYSETFGDVLDSCLQAPNEAEKCQQTYINLELEIDVQHGNPA